MIKAVDMVRAVQKQFGAAPAASMHEAIRGHASVWKGPQRALRRPPGHTNGWSGASSETEKRTCLLRHAAALLKTMQIPEGVQVPAQDHVAGVARPGWLTAHRPCVVTGKAVSPPPHPPPSRGCPPRPRRAPARGRGVGGGRDRFASDHARSMGGQPAWACHTSHVVLSGYLDTLRDLHCL